MMFRITGGKGFHITFKNNLTVSVQFGHGNYCENYMKENVSPVECVDAEIGVWDEAGHWFTNEFVNCEGDDVKGRLRPYKIAEIIYAVSKYGVE